MTTKTDAIKNFVGRSSIDFFTNPFTKIDVALLSDIGEERFYAYLDMIAEGLSPVGASVDEVETVLSYISDIEETAIRQIVQILKNEKAKTMFHLMGKEDIHTDSMEIVSMDGFVFSMRENGWVFE